MSESILIFDIPKGLHNIQVKAWRGLNSINARKIQHSVWKSNDLNELMKIAMFIKKSGGNARILEEKFVF